MVVVAYGLILPQSVLDIPTLRLLERARLAAAALARRRADPARDRSRRQRNRRVPDADGEGPGHRPGAAVADTLDIGEDETGGQLHDRLAALGAQVLADGLGLLRAGIRPVPQPQPEEGVDLRAQARQGRGEARLVAARARAGATRCAPSIPGRWPKREVAGERLRIHGAVALDDAHQAPPGTLLRASRDGLDVACGEGALRIRVLQREGGKAITAADYLNARRDLRTAA